MNSFEFRALRPTYVCADGRALKVCGEPDGNGVRLLAQDHEVWLTVQATATATLG